MFKVHFTLIYMIPLYDSSGAMRLALNVLQFCTSSTLSGTDPNPISSMSLGSDLDGQSSESDFYSLDVVQITI